MSQGSGHHSIFEITIDIVRRISIGTRTNHCMTSGATTHTVGRSHFHILERCVKHSQKNLYKKNEIYFLKYGLNYIDILNYYTDFYSYIRSYQKYNRQYE